MTLRYTLVYSEKVMFRLGLNSSNTRGMFPLLLWERIVFSKKEMMELTAQWLSVSLSLWSFLTPVASVVQYSLLLSLRWGTVPSLQIDREEGVHRRAIWIESSHNPSCRLHNNDRKFVLI